MKYVNVTVLPVACAPVGTFLGYLLAVCPRRYPLNGPSNHSFKSWSILVPARESLPLEQYALMNYEHLEEASSRPYWNKTTRAGQKAHNAARYWNVGSTVCYVHRRRPQIEKSVHILCAA